MEPYPLWLRQLIARIFERAMSEDPEGVHQLVESIDAHQLPFVLTAIRDVEVQLEDEMNVVTS